jgi:hypothetical protein
MKWFIKTYTFWYELYKELRIWWIFRKTVLNNVELLNNNNLRVDYIGRVYTVVNLPEEVAGAAPQAHQAYVLQQITKYGNVMMKIGLADVVYPEIEQIKDSAAYLVILWPVFDKFQLFTILGSLIRTTVQTGIFYFIYRLIMNYIDFNTISQLIVNQF